MLIRCFRELNTSSPQRRERNDERGTRNDERDKVPLNSSFIIHHSSLLSRLCGESSLIIYALSGLLLLFLPLAIQAQTGQLKVTTGQAGSVVFINKVRHGATNDKGELDLPRVKVGSFPVRVRTVGFVDWNGAVVIAAKGNRSLKVTQQPLSDPATLYYQKGDDLREKGRNKDAIAEYQQALVV